MKKRRLTPDEDTLWRRLTRDVAKLAPGPERIGEAPAPPLVSSRDGSPLSTTARRAYAPCDGGPAPIMAHSSTVQTGRRAHASSVVGGGDPALDKRVSRRRMPIDRTIDLHGLTQAAAQVALRGFLESSARDQCRCILVITGKGGLGAEGRGVLHSRFTEWINDDALGPLVSRAAPAHQKDGGAGAWYVFLKRR